MNILNLQVGNVRKLIVKSVEIKDITKNNKEGILEHQKKINFKVEDPYNKKEFDISDVWIDTPDGIQIKGLWLALQNGDTQIQKNSTVARLIEHYKIETLNNFVGKTVDVYPDKQNFLVLVACSLPDNF
jgi:hypothetical protein